MVGHYIRQYLARTSTFVYTLLRFQERYGPVVFAPELANVEEFPIEPLVRLRDPGAPVPLKAVRKAAASVSGFRTTHDHRLHRGLRQFDCKVLHAHFAWSACMALDAWERDRLPLVTTFYGHDLVAPQQDESWVDPYRRLFASGSAFICEGSAMARQLAGIGCPEERIRVVKIGLDMDQFEYRPRPKPVGEPLVFVQTARFVEKKGVDLSIRAFAAARDRLPSSELWLVGDGDSRAELERLADRLGVAASVKFLGLLAHDRYRQALERADVGLQPSRTASNGDTEGGAPTVLLETQAAGKPVVATRHADIPEVVAAEDALADENDVDGIADALVRVAGLAPDEWDERCRAGRMLVEQNHDARTTARDVEAVYDELLTGRSGGRRDRKLAVAAGVDSR